MDLEPDGLRGSLALPEDRLDRRQQVVGCVDLDIEIEVPGDAERVHRHDLHPREQQVEVRGDHVLLRDEPLAVGQRHEPGDVRRYLHPCEPADLRRGIAHHDRQVQRQVGDVRERVCRVDGQGREDREHPLLEHLTKMHPIVSAEVLPVDDADPGRVQPRPNALRPDLVLTLHEQPHAPADRIELLSGRHAVGRRRGQPDRQLFLQSGNTDLEELVQVDAEDGQEAHAFQERPGIVLGHREDAGVEVQPRQLTVVEPAGRRHRSYLRDGRRYLGFTGHGEVLIIGDWSVTNRNPAPGGARPVIRPTTVGTGHRPCGRGR